MTTFTRFWKTAALITLLFAFPAIAHGAYIKKSGDSGAPCGRYPLVSGTVGPVLGTPRPEGVLTGCAQDSFSSYLEAIISEQSGTILLIALVMIIFSGVQYMLSGVNPEIQKQAKQRIVGIVVGVVFFLSIQLIIAQISNVKSINTVTL